MWCLLFTVFTILTLNTILSVNGEPKRSEPDVGDVFKYIGNNIGCGLILMTYLPQCQSESSEALKEAPPDLAICCTAFDVTKCLVSKAKEKCDYKAYSSFQEKAKQYMDGLTDNQCKDYGHRWYDPKSWKCHVPWIQIIIVIGVVLAVVIVTALMIALFNK